jgi:hypothetical protein
MEQVACCIRHRDLNWDCLPESRRKYIPVGSLFASLRTEAFRQAVPVQISHEYQILLKRSQKRFEEIAGRRHGVVWSGMASLRPSVRMDANGEPTGMPCFYYFG